MAISNSNNKAPARGAGPDQAGGGPSATAGSARATSKPHKRSARGSDVAKREKLERRAGRKQEGASGRGATDARAGIPHAGSGRFSAANAQVAKDGGRAKRAKAPRAPQQDLMRFASDSAPVRWFYALTTGPRRHFFYLAVALLVLMGVYGPVRDLYVAHRTVMILEEQTAIREEYNEALGDEVGGLMSEEGIEDAARKDLGMVMPGEQTITVEGLDDEGNPVVVDPGEGDGSAQGETSEGEASSGAAEDDDSGKLKGADAADKSKTGSGSASGDPSKKPTTSAEVEAAEHAVLENSAWYWKLLDAIFLFDGVNGMAVVSTGE